MKVNKSLIKRYFKAHLGTSVKWAVNGMLVIYDKQTISEQSTDSTHELNCVGFSGCDAEIMSSFSKQVRNGRTLSPKQMAIVFKKMPKYWEQLWDNSKDQEKTFAAAVKWELAIQEYVAPVPLKCPDNILPDGPVCPKCGGNRAPSGVDGGSWVHFDGVPKTHVINSGREWCDNRGF